jgi:polyphosphate kinase 2 (PPK2 family)
LKRFQARENDPEKQWKITPEDWRNREKWDLYKPAIEEMLVRTSTLYAPWTVVESNDKRYARVKVLETLVKLLEENL